MVTMVSFLFSPKPVSQADYCGTYIKINKWAGFIRNCDTKYSVNPALYLKSLLEPNTIRQARPLYILFAALLGSSLEIVIHLIGLDYHKEAIFYFAFVLLNFITLYLGIILYCRILASFDIDKFLIISFSIFLICNDTTKAFFWTPHQQMFNIFTPLFIIFIMSRILLAPKMISNKKYLLITLLSGVLLLVYGNFILVLPCILASFLYKAYLENSINNRELLFTAIISMALFLIPTLLWIALVTLTAGHYYNHEITAYRQLVWIIDKMQLGIYEFARYLKHYSIKYISTFSLEILTFLIVSFVLICNSFIRGIKEEGWGLVKRNDRYAIMLQILFTSSAIILFFYWILGFYTSRLTFTIVPVLLCHLTLKLNNIIKANPQTVIMVRSITIIFAAFWFVYHVLKYGPFS